MAGQGTRLGALTIYIQMSRGFLLTPFFVCTLESTTKQAATKPQANQPQPQNHPKTHTSSPRNTRKPHQTHLKHLKQPPKRPDPDLSPTRSGANA